MARIREAISLLLIGGGLGALAANGRDRIDLEGSVGRLMQAAALTSSRAVQTQDENRDAALVPRGEAGPYVRVAGHRVLAANTVEAIGSPPSRTDSEALVRFAQVAVRLPAAHPAPVPTTRPILIGARDKDAAVGDDGRSAEARLAEAIQKELQRVGCYKGNIDGDWGPETRRAMQAFNDRVNARLPTGQPDYILLTLLQGHAAKACGAACPLGQELTDAGKCLPRSVIAEERRRLAADRAIAGASRAAVAQSTRDETGRPGDASRGIDSGTQAPRASDLAETERQRIAAAEARRKQRAAEAAAHAEAERIARLAAADKARLAAEMRRREELAALSARAAQRTAAVAARPLVPGQSSVTTGSIAAVSTPPLPARPSQAFREQVAALRDVPRVDLATAAPAEPRTTRRHRQRPARGARYAEQFVPPTYRVGRLPPRVYAYAPPPVYRRAHNPQRIFRELQYRMP